MCVCVGAYVHACARRGGGGEEGLWVEVDTKNEVSMAPECLQQLTRYRIIGIGIEEEKSTLCPGDRGAELGTPCPKRLPIL